MEALTKNDILKETSWESEHVKSLTVVVSLTDVSHKALYQEEGSVNHVQSVFEVP